MFSTFLSAGSGPDPNYKFISVWTHAVLASAVSNSSAHVFGAVLNCRLPLRWVGMKLTGEPKGFVPGTDQWKEENIARSDTV